MPKKGARPRNPPRCPRSAREWRATQSKLGARWERAADPRTAGCLEASVRGNGGLKSPKYCRLAPRPRFPLFPPHLRQIPSRIASPGRNDSPQGGRLGSLAAISVPVDAMIPNEETVLGSGMQCDGNGQLNSTNETDDLPNEAPRERRRRCRSPRNLAAKCRPPP